MYTRVSSRLFAGAVSHCSATLRACQIMYWPKQFCAWQRWHATSEMEFHPPQTGADHGAVLLSPGCTRFVQTVVCLLEMPSTALRIGPCGACTLWPPRPRVDDDDNVYSPHCNVCKCSLLCQSSLFHSSSLALSLVQTQPTFYLGQ